MRLIQQGIDAGHTIGITHREPPAEWIDHGARTKYWGSCSCGFKSTARFTKAVALGAAFRHLGEVMGEPAVEAPVKDGGVSLPRSVAGGV
jgi:hypothetical protein